MISPGLARRLSCVFSTCLVAAGGVGCSSSAPGSGGTAGQAGASSPGAGGTAGSGAAGTAGAAGTGGGSGAGGSVGGSGTAGASTTDGKPFLQAAWDAAIPTGTYRYYDGSLYLLAMLHMTGKLTLGY